MPANAPDVIDLSTLDLENLDILTGSNLGSPSSTLLEPLSPTSIHSFGSMSGRITPGARIHKLKHILI